MVDKKNCTTKPDPPDVFAAYTISDSEIGLRFMKPITDDYDYKLFYKSQADQYYTESRYWATYGPIWSDVIGGLQPSTTYTVRVRLACSKNSSMTSNADTGHKATFAKRKQYIILLCSIPSI